MDVPSFSSSAVTAQPDTDGSADQVKTACLTITATPVIPLCAISVFEASELTDILAAVRVEHPLSVFRRPQTADGQNDLLIKSSYQVFFWLST